MLTGDENIIDIDFSVFWLVKIGGAGDYLFNTQQPQGAVKAVAENAMREVVGQSQIQPILTEARGSGTDVEDARYVRRWHSGDRCAQARADSGSRRDSHAIGVPVAGRGWLP